MVGTQHGMDWRTLPSNEKIFYMMNSQQCSFLVFSDYTTNIALNVLWGLLLLVMGVVIIGFNISALRGLYETTTRSGDYFNSLIYANVSILNLAFGLCTFVSAGIMMSNFTWDETDGGGKFLCNLFGVLFTLVVQTKLLLITSGLFVAVVCQLAGFKMQKALETRLSAVVLVMSWVLGIIHAFLPYMYGSTYSQPDYLLMCIGSFSGMSHDKTDNYYAGQLVLFFIPLFLGILLCLFTVPGMILAKNSNMVYKWDDEFWTVFTTTTLFMSYLICHATFYIVHISGMSELDSNTGIDFCSLDIYNMRYFFTFMVFTMYLSGIAEPLSFLTANMDMREKLSLTFSPDSSKGNRVTPLLVDVRHAQKTPDAPASIATGANAVEDTSNI